MDSTCILTMLFYSSLVNKVSTIFSKRVTTLLNKKLRLHFWIHPIQDVQTCFAKALKKQKAIPRVEPVEPPQEAAS